MAEDVKGDALTHELRESFAKTIRTAVAGLPAHQALQLADTLCSVQLDVLAGLRVSYKAKPTVDGLAIAEDWALGKPLREVMRDNKCSRVTAYKYHPTKGKKQKTAAR